MLPVILFARLVFASLLADFLFQPSSLVVWKQRQFRGLVVHVIVVFVTSLVVGQGFWSGRYLALVAATAFAHLIVDWAKIGIDRRRPHGYWPLGTFVADQALHIITLLVLLGFFEYVPPVKSAPILESFFGDPGKLAIASVYLVSVIGGSVVVRFIVQPFGVEIKDRPALLGAGAYIGMIERLLVTTLVAVGQFGAVGFVLAAKSVARYRQLEEVPGFAEYYLVGTLTSSVIAVLAGMLIGRILN